MLNIESLNESNTYEVTMYEMGERGKVVINDKIITLKEANNTLSHFFLKSKGYDVWAYFFEKAYAQRVGLYSSVRFGNVFESIYSFVGGEYEVYWIMEDREDTIWLFLLNNLIKNPKKSSEQALASHQDRDKDAVPEEKPEDKKKHVQEYITNDIDELRKIITVSNNVWNHDQNYKHDKEFDGQFFSYVLLDAKSLAGKKLDVKDPDQDIWIKLLKIDDMSYLKKCLKKKWSKNHVSELESETQVGKGYCWISFRDLIKKFKVLSMNTFKYLHLKELSPQRAPVESIFKITMDGEHSCCLLRFEVLAEGDRVTIGLHQKHKQYLKNVLPNYKYSNFRLFLLRLTPEEFSKDYVSPQILDTTTFDASTKGKT